MKIKLIKKQISENERYLLFPYIIILNKNKKWVKSNINTYTNYEIGTRLLLMKLTILKLNWIDFQ